MNQPAFHDVQMPIGNGAAPADVHARGGVFSSVFGSSNTLISAARLILDVDIPPAMTFVEFKAVAPFTQPSSTSFSEQDKSLTWLGTLRFRGSIGDASKILGERVKARRTGPVQVLSKIANVWQLSHAELASLLAYPDSQSAADLLDGRTSLRNPDREDRVRLLYRIYRILSSGFSEVAQQQSWLRTANPNLHNKSPLEFMMERRIPGMISVQNLVERLVAR
jgi:hypothetical protein